MADEWFVAQDTFNAELPGGGQVTVPKGSTWHKSEHVVQLDAGRNQLFLPQRSGAEEPPVKRSRLRAGKSVAAGGEDAAVPALAAAGEADAPGAAGAGAAPGADGEALAGAWGGADDGGVGI